MKIIVRKLDSIIIYGTNDNATTIDVVDNDLVIDGQVIATNVNEFDYDLIENTGQDLIEPFYVGYTTYTNGVFAYTESYLLFNTKTHNCLITLSEEYTVKANDPAYTDEERIAFEEYVQTLNVVSQSEYLQPVFEYPCPPDELFPFYPKCSE